MMTLTLSGESSPRNVYRIITDQVVRQLEQGVAPWRKPWHADLPLNLISGKPYRGINVFLLASQGYESRYWLTFNQALDNSAAYLQSWLNVLKSDSRMVVTAASAAQKAADYILGRSQGDGEEGQ